MQFKKKMQLVMMAVILGCILGCAQKTNESNVEVDWCKKKLICETDKSCKQANLKRDDNSKKVKRFKNISFAQINKEIKDKSTFLLYLGFDECPWCVEAVPVLDDVAISLKKTVYYTDIYKNGKDLRNPNSKSYKEFLNTFSEILGPEGTLYAPTVIAIREGEPIGINIGTLKEHNARERKMNQEETRLLKNIYNDLYKMIECKAKH